MNLLAVIDCERCGGELQPVVIGKIFSGRECNTVFECADCHSPVRVSVSVTPAFTELDCDLNNNLKEAAHGTESGYSRHRREGTAICEWCAKAHREANARRAGRTKVSA